MTYDGKLKTLSDDELLRRLSELLGKSRRVESELVAHIGEVDERKLYVREACSSMFSYCTEVLHLSEFEAYLRIAVARAARAHPVLLGMLEDGRLHLSGIAKLSPHLDRLKGAKREELLARAAHETKREIEELITEFHPKPDVPSRVRKLPERKPKVTPDPVAALGPDQVEAPSATPLHCRAQRANPVRQRHAGRVRKGNRSLRGATGSPSRRAPSFTIS